MMLKLAAWHLEIECVNVSVTKSAGKASGHEDKDRTAQSRRWDSDQWKHSAINVILLFQSMRGAFSIPTEESFKKQRLWLVTTWASFQKEQLILVIWAQDISCQKLQQPAKRVSGVVGRWAPPPPNMTMNSGFEPHCDKNPRHIEDVLPTNTHISQKPLFDGLFHW